MINDISAFMAFGKRVSVDIKLHGLTSVLDQIQYESNDPYCDSDLVDIIVPRVIELFARSQNPRIREAGRQLKSSVSFMEYSDLVFIPLIAAIMSANSDDA